jgi:hypothetical protein
MCFVLLCLSIEGVWFESEGVWFESEGVWFESEGVWFESEGVWFMRQRKCVFVCVYIIRH